MGSRKSMPASSAIWARRTLSSQLPDHRSGALVTNRPEEQFGPKKPSFSLLRPYMATRSAREAWAGMVSAQPAQLGREIRHALHQVVLGLIANLLLCAPQIEHLLVAPERPDERLGQDLDGRARDRPPDGLGHVLRAAERA